MVPEVVFFLALCQISDCLKIPKCPYIFESIGDSNTFVRKCTGSIPFFKASTGNFWIVHQLYTVKLLILIPASKFQQSKDCESFWGRPTWTSESIFLRNHWLDFSQLTSISRSTFFQSKKCMGIKNWKSLFLALFFR